MSSEQEHVLGADGQFHVEDEAVDLSSYGWEDWATFVLFWIMAAVVFYQVYTRYVLSDSAGWTEEIARYFLVAVVFIGASMSVRKNNHIQVDYFYRLMPKAMESLNERAGLYQWRASVGMAVIGRARNVSRERVRHFPCQRAATSQGQYH
jgi:hypothetical protein